VPAAADTDLSDPGTTRVWPGETRMTDRQTHRRRPGFLGSMGRASSRPEHSEGPGVTQTPSPARTIVALCGDPGEFYGAATVHPGGPGRTRQWGAGRSGRL
jgi:hypothetical protein